MVRCRERDWNLYVSFNEMCVYLRIFVFMSRPAEKLLMLMNAQISMTCTVNFSFICKGKFLDKSRNNFRWNCKNPPCRKVRPIHCIGYGSNGFNVEPNIWGTRIVFFIENCFDGRHAASKLIVAATHTTIMKYFLPSHHLVESYRIRSQSTNHTQRC